MICCSIDSDAFSVTQQDSVCFEQSPHGGPAFMVDLLLIQQPIFVRRLTNPLLKKSGKMGRILEAYIIGNFTD